MEIEKCKYRMTCELGACGNRAEYSVKFAKAGTKSNLNVCADCLKELARLAESVCEERAEDKQGERRKGK